MSVMTSNLIIETSIHQSRDSNAGNSCWGLFASIALDTITLDCLSVAPGVNSLPSSHVVQVICFTVLHQLAVDHIWRILDVMTFCYGSYGAYIYFLWTIIYTKSIQKWHSIFSKSNSKRYFVTIFTLKEMLFLVA